ncbi:FAM193 family C-terminal [Popillia japonica]|uniref:FAM193 family C-terminal n=1 Tax=Popillia japonica TaxID=7064 RepID=A0AAW1NAN0_POPJA
MGIMSSRAQHFQSKSNSNLTSSLSKEAAFCNLLRSPETIKWLFERPNEYMHKIFENDSWKDTLRSAIDESETKVIKHRILYNFIKELRDFRPPQAMEWTAFHHYMYYVYRNFLSSKPCPNNEALPNVLVKKMYELVVSLSFEDRTQFYVRIITLLREYVMTARDNYDNLNINGDAVTYLKCLLSYYSAFCSAANKIATVLSEFDQFMNERFNINWYCLHQRMFFQYFFMVATVQSKVSIFNQLIEANLAANRDLIVGYKNFIDDMTVLDRHWELQRRRISSNSEKIAREESQASQKNWKMFEEITKIMKTNFWIIRSSEHWKLNRESRELEGHFLAVVEDTWHVADRLIAPEGNCICEDCMTAEFRQGIFSNPVRSRTRSITPNDRLVMCYICRDVLALDLLGEHIAGEHADLNIPRADLTKSYKWQSSNPSAKKGAAPVKRPSMKLCKVLSETMAKTKDAQLFKVNDSTFKIKCDSDGHGGGSAAKQAQLSKRTLECPIRGSNAESSKKFAPEMPDGFSAVNVNVGANLNVNGRIKNDKEPIMKIASEPPVFASNNFSDEMESCRAAFQEFVRNRKDDAVPNRRTDERKDASGKMQNSLEFTSSKFSSAGNNGRSGTENGCAGHVCGHNCRKEEQPTCDHQKETKKCDCAYCEVFGSNVAAHSHKSSETRDRLRSRLNQRKEKINENTKSAPADVPGPNPWNARTDPINIPNKAAHRNANPANGSESQTNLCNCSHNKTSCQNCVPINIKVLGNPSVDKSSSSSLASGSIPENPKSVDKAKSAAASASRSPNDLPDLSDIDGLLDFIQGNKPIDKIAMAQKKAAKKARQKLKKEQERSKKEAEEEAKRLEEERLKEEKRRREEALRAQALALARQVSQSKNKNRKSKRPKSPALPQTSGDPKSKAKNSKSKQSLTRVFEANDPDSELMEETIPAMVTIKRVVENNNSPPTVTITLKGSTPDQDKLLYTLVNGHASDYAAVAKDTNIGAGTVSTTSKNNKCQEQNRKTYDINLDNGSTNHNNNHGSGSKKKKKTKNCNTVTTKELKVTLAVDKSFHKGKCAMETKETRKEKSTDNCTKPPNPVVLRGKHPSKRNDDRNDGKSPANSAKDLEIDIPSLKLPPGITITKVNGPIKCKPTPASPTANTGPQYPTVPPVSKSGVIVVDTEKLIQKSISANVNKKTKKKKNKKQQQQQQQQVTKEPPHDSVNTVATTNKGDSKPPTMVTLKNPIFHTLQTQLVEKRDIPAMPFNEQASITKGENGMVTIRRPRCLQLPIEKEPSMNDFLGELRPTVAPNTTVIPDTESKERIEADSTVSAGPKSGLSAHDILWGLPGIEITKVNKNATGSDAESKKSCQAADVSIIPTGGGTSNPGEKFNLDRDDWPFESVFAPKDILEDDLDADERELEAFKRFCQQSIPPKHKEKVAHLNVKDIVLKKKNDIAYS